MPESDKIRRKTNLLWKWVFICALITTLFLAYWTLWNSYETTLLVRLELYGKPDFLTIVHSPSKTFEVRVRGSKSAIGKLKGADLAYPVSLADSREGAKSIAIESERLKLPKGISVVRISTGDTMIKLEKTIQKSVPVVLQVTGNPSFGYRVAEKLTNPPSLALKGPESKLAPLESALTHPIDINGVAETVNAEVTPDLPEGVSVEPGQQPLTATVIIEEDRTEKTFPDIPVNGHNTKYKFLIRPETISLTVNGTIRAFSENFSVQAFAVYLDLNGLPPGIHVKPAVIDLPEGMRLVKAEPQLFTVEILKNRKRKR